MLKALYLPLGLSAIYILSRLWFNPYISPQSDFAQTWYSNGELNSYEKNGVFFFAVGLFKNIGLNYSEVSLLISTLTLFVVVHQLNSIYELAQSRFFKFALPLFYFEIFRYWFFTGNQLEPRIVSISLFTVAVRYLLEFYRDRTKHCLVLSGFFFCLSVNIQTQSLIILPIIFILHSFRKNALPKTVKKSLYLTYFVIGLSVFLFTTYISFAQENTTRVEIASKTAYYFGFVSDNALINCGAWNMDDAINLSKNYKSVNLKSILTRSKDFSYDSKMIRCKISRFFLSPYAGDVTWVYDLGSKAKFSQSTSPILKNYLLNGLIQNGYVAITLLLWCSFAFICCTRQYLSYFLVLTYFFTAITLFELNTRYFFHYIFLIALILVSANKKIFDDVADQSRGITNSY